MHIQLYIHTYKCLIYIYIGQADSVAMAIVLKWNIRDSQLTVSDITYNSITDPSCYIMERWGAGRVEEQVFSVGVKRP